MRIQNLLSVIMAAALFVGYVAAQPLTPNDEAVAYWNQQAQIKMFIPSAGRPGPSGVIDLAVVHAAIYDAVQAIEKRYEPYYLDITVPAVNCSTDAAVAQAARNVLVARFASNAAFVAAVEADYNGYIAAKGLAGNPCLAVGAEAAAGILALRVGDGAFPSPAPPPFIGNLGIGQWRPTPGTTFFNPGHWFGLTRPFLIRRPGQFRSVPPPALNSHHYARDYNEVKAYGGDAATGSLRSPEQTEMALFFSGNFGAQMNGLVRQLAVAHQLDTADSARLFALTTMSNADTAIAVWNDKAFYNFWRPITAIQNGHLDGNSRTAVNPTWNSLIASPPYPDYGSGANGFTSSTAYALQYFFGRNRMSFSIPSVVAASPNTRFYTSFSQLRQEVVDARVLLGIHFRFADEAARLQGQRVARYAIENHFQPLGRHGDGDDDDDDDGDDD